MAHLPLLTRALAAFAFATVAAHAVELGELEVASALGEPLDARVPLKAAPGERFEPACFYVSHAGLPEGARLTMTLERSARGTALRIRGTTPLEVPAANLRVSVACPGKEAQPPRDFALLLDPRSRIRAPSVAGGAPAAPPQIGATITAPESASLESIARTLVPQDEKARSVYLDALQAANPQLAARGRATTIEPGTEVALPDLRTFASTRRASAQGQLPLARENVAAADAAPKPAETTATRAAERPARAPAVRRPAPVEVEVPPPPTRTAAAPAPASAAPAPVPSVAPAERTQVSKPEPPAKAAAPRTSAQGAGGFVLRLSGGEVDLSRSRGIDDRRRAQLRERQLVLDSDDQLAAFLAMRHSLKQLEARVSELQLKLAAMPEKFPERPASAKTADTAAKTPTPPPPPATPPGMPDRVAPPSTPATAATPTQSSPATPAPVPAPATAPTATTAVKPTPAPVPPAAPPQASPQPAASTPPPPTPVSPPAAASKPAPATVPVVKTPATKPGTATPSAAKGWELETLRGDYGWWLVALLVGLALAIALLVWRRRARSEGELVEEVDEDAVPEPEAPVAGDIGEIASAVAAPVRVEAPRPSMASDADLPTRLRDTDSGDLRRRYIEERFPEVASRAIRLEDTDSVVKGARLFYEDGELTRAVELLQLAIDARPGEVRLWLALFEIFRLERLSGEFGQLATRFQERHGESEHWRKVQYFGREVDPGNPLYKLEPIATLETIGPREARKLAAAKAAFDPIAENWLNAPMDFENEVLANDLRRSLMAEAGIAEQDLQPAPMTALRNVEMFTVA